MSFKKVKVNNHKCDRIPQFGMKDDKRPVKGKDIVAEPFANIALIGRKEVGKTSAMYKLLLECLTPDTTVYIFSHTVKKDPNWINMRKWMELKKIPHTCFTEIAGNLRPIVMQLQKRADEEEAARNGDNYENKMMNFITLSHLRFDSDSDEEDSKKRKSKYLVPDAVFIFDDIGEELRSPDIISILKENRHWRLKCIFSTQAVMDLFPSSRRMIDLWLIFRGELEKLPEIYRNASVKVPYPIFEAMYLEATDTIRLKYNKGDVEKKLYEFFYVDQANKDYREGWSKRFILPDNIIEDR